MGFNKEYDLYAGVGQHSSEGGKNGFLQGMYQVPCPAQFLVSPGICSFQCQKGAL